MFDNTQGKYWKRKMATILAEYKKWRIFYKNQNDVQRPHIFNDRTFYKVLNSVDNLIPYFYNIFSKYLIKYLKPYFFNAME